ncbi:MAG: helix-turn-helix transcriptional regulator, partial [Pseudomonadota bacterium]
HVYLGGGIHYRSKVDLDTCNQSSSCVAPRIEVGEIRFIEEIADSLGIDQSALLESTGLPPDFFTWADSDTLSLSVYFRLLAYISERAGDETVTASQRTLQLGTAQLILSGITEQMTLFDAMLHIANAYNVVHAGPYNYVHRRPDRIVYKINDRGFPFAIDAPGHTRHVFMESVLVFLNAILEEVSAAPLTDVVLRVDSRRRIEMQGGAFLKPWRAPIRYGATVYAVHYDASVMQIPVRPARATAFASAPVYQVVANRVAAAYGHERKAKSIEDSVVASLHNGPCTQEDVAETLQMSVASLRRRLRDAGTSFRQLKAQVRAEQARTLLRYGHEIADVAERLGFSDARSFSRAFKSQTGTTPADYRNKAQS